MSLYCAANGFRDDQSDARPAVGGAVRRSQRVHHEVGLHRPHPLTDRGTELRGPRHPVPRRKHRASSRVESRSELAATLAAAVRHDRPAGAGAHPQPEPMHPRATAVVGLEGPLALGHGCSLLVAYGIRKPTPMNPHTGGTRLPLVSSSVSLANRRGHQKLLGRSRTATFGRLFEGTDEISLGQTSLGAAGMLDKSHSRHAPRTPQNIPMRNVAERLAPGQKTVSFCQCRFDNETATDNEAGMPNQSRAHRTHYHCDEPRPAAFPPVDNRATATVLSPQPVDNYVDSSSSFIWSSPERPQGGSRL
jgi:hypothetical protein